MSAEWNKELAPTVHRANSTGTPAWQAGAL